MISNLTARMRTSNRFACVKHYAGTTIKLSCLNMQFSVLEYFEHVNYACLHGWTDAIALGCNRVDGRTVKKTESKAACVLHCFMNHLKVDSCV